MVLKSGKRSFTIVNVTSKAGKYKKLLGGANRLENRGRYVSSTPVGAAKKAFSNVCGNYLGRHKLKGKCSMVIEVKDITAGAPTYGKRYKYHIQRDIVNRKVKVKGKMVNFKYDVKAKAM